MSERLRAAVVVPTWNGAAYVLTALRSIEASAKAARHDIVVAVCDDGSTDGTVDVVQSFAESADVPVTLVVHDTNRGTGAARNTAIASAAERDAACYLFLDQDDEYRPEHVAACLDALAADPRLDFVRTDVLLDRPVHPHWQRSIADTLVQTLCVRSFAHRLVGGFLDDAATATVGCDDVFYSRLLHRHLRGARLPSATVHFHQRDGNAFDRQWEHKFSRAPEDAQPTLTGARLAAEPAARAAFEQRARDVEQRVRRLRSI